MSETPVTADHAGEGDPWPCGDYRAPLTCWTVPSGRKVLICAGCRDAFPGGAETQALYQDALRERVEALAEKFHENVQAIVNNDAPSIRHREVLRSVIEQLRALLAPAPSATPSEES